MACSRCHVTSPADTPVTLDDPAAALPAVLAGCVIPFTPAAQAKSGSHSSTALQKKGVV
jgi:hypothetical protein